VIPAPFDYVRAESVDHALALLAEHGDEAKPLAGGHSLLPLMKLRLATPAVLVDVGRLDELRGVRLVDGAVEIGALTRHHELETSPVLAEHLPLLAHAASQVGDPQVRHRGTLGGSLCHGDPASDLAAVVLALGATLVVQGPGGTRELPAIETFTGFLETAVGPDELLTAVRIPAATGAPWSFQKFTRRAQDWAVAGVAAVRRPQGCGIALVNMGPTPLLASAAMAAVDAGQDAEAAAELAAEGTEPPSDVAASPEYRAQLARVLVRRALEEAGVSR